MPKLACEKPSQPVRDRFVDGRQHLHTRFEPNSMLRVSLRQRLHTNLRWTRLLTVLHHPLCGSRTSAGDNCLSRALSRRQRQIKIAFFLSFHSSVRRAKWQICVSHDWFRITTSVCSGARGGAKELRGRRLASSPSAILRGGTSRVWGQIARCVCFIASSDWL